MKDRHVLLSIISQTVKHIDSVPPFLAVRGNSPSLDESYRWYLERAFRGEVDRSGGGIKSLG